MALDWLRREGDSSNTTIGIVLLLMLFVFVGPSVLPSLLARTIPFIDEGIPCTRLRQAEDRANHQSLIGRNTRNPLNLRLVVGDVPLSQDGELLIRLIIENNTIGSVPIVFDERQIIVGDDPASSGFGLIFNPPTGLSTGGFRQTQGDFIPEASIRILGPRQRCVHRISFPGSVLPLSLLNGTTTVQAYYRINTSGAFAQGAGIYPDQGLAIIAGGFITSPPVTIPAPASNAP